MSQPGSLSPPTDADLLGYLDELLPPDDAATIETALRSDASLRQRAAGLLRDRDAGAHTLADIWRRGRLSCPGRFVLGGYLLGTLPPLETASVEVHLEAVGCRWCRADVDALIAARSDPDAARRRERVFESSIGRR